MRKKRHRLRVVVERLLDVFGLWRLHVRLLDICGCEDFVVACEQRDIVADAWWAETPEDDPRTWTSPYDLVVHANAEESGLPLSYCPDCGARLDVLVWADVVIDCLYLGTVVPVRWDPSLFLPRSIGICSEVTIVRVSSEGPWSPKPVGSGR